MIELTAAQIAQITGGRAVGDAAAREVVVGHVTTDSREARPGTLFVAKPGEVTDGHEFVGAAFAAGAVLALVEREVTDAAGAAYPGVLVPDVVEAMGRLAAWVVAQLRADHEVTVVAVTGSVGKTTTKDLLRGILSAEGPTVAPRGSYNGEVGVPLTVFECTSETRYLVVEMGATRIGNIDYLCRMVRPDVGVVLCVGSAHAGEFGGVANIARAKGEMVESLRADGVAVLNDDDALVRQMHRRTVAPVLFFGESPANALPDVPAARVHASEVRLGPGGSPEFLLHFPDGSAHRIVSRLIGEHHVSNLLAAASAAFVAGVAPERIAASLNAQGPASRWRMERTERADGVTVVNDAYNANPQSMRAALQTLAQLGRGTGGSAPRRTWAVLGGMLELGDSTVEEHDALGRMVVRLNISKLVAVGELARPVYDAAQLEGSWGNEATWVATAEEAEEILRRELAPGDIVLFKASNASGLGVLGDRVAATASAGADGPAPGNDAPARGDHWRSAGPFVNASLDASGRPVTPGAAAEGDERA
ncbi:UDP-N-acetylmuramoyl-tripeptide--D-alanyl-D-alanine ligase [Kocuria sediminis]|uniref:UDP-N-acetylmuramoyl-tripeptide--D-alanyl-D-alanine ligase n=1 Tax=Kocuria sediminis TaxID=1038857 RepID=A0A6N8GT61_9MICC|nr:UDP-N-acetylmuramoyl-tripeptide--D-alanyl-D-alanine ligase [Kocuria sediminis]MUN64115.1 UDP-N-acetylmuramoyl-tripeptide--D-alanyl-D-alanine ligase [Kocuria sediminis]